MAIQPSPQTSPRRRGHLLGVLPALALWCALPGVAHAGLAEDALARGEARLAQLEPQVDEVESDLGPGALVDELSAVNRFQDSMFHHLIGEHEPAAEGFFALVTTGSLTDAGLHRDAEWYLAESLLGMRNYVTAEQRFQAIVDDMEHPFRADAVRRLLELYTEKGDVEGFRRLYDAEIVTGRVPSTPDIVYSLARSFYRQGDYAQAQGYFEQIEPGTEWHAKARYFIGVIAVAQERLDDAIAEFQRVAELSITSADGRRVHDLALLALGRIHYERGDYLQASIEYNRIGGDSEYEADKLYEVIWTSIKQKRFRDAINNIEIFLLAFPEHRYSAQLMLNQGHLAVQASDWSGALVSYEQVIVDYEPVRSRFASLADPQADSDETVAAVLDVNRPELEGGLPSYALAMMRADPELTRAVNVFADLDVQRADIEASEELVRELELAMGDAGGIQNLAQIRYDATVLRTEVLSAILDLLEGEEAWLTESDEAAALIAGEIGGRRRDLQAALQTGVAEITSMSDRMAQYEQRLTSLQSQSDALTTAVEEGQAEIDSLRAQLADNASLDRGTREQIEADLQAAEAELQTSSAEAAALDEQVATLRAPSVVRALAKAGVDIDQLAADVRALVAEARAARPAGRSLQGDRYDAMHLQAARLESRLAKVVSSSVTTESNELGRIRKRFAAEKQAVATQRADYAASLDIAKDVSLQLTRAGFGRLEDFFAESVLKADMGIVDVYWAQKLEVADEIERVKTEKDALLTELQQRFKLIRQKIGN
jgi:tetratricopeptide (TPR) repeat protein